jgi:hypothetical protein
MPPEPPSAQRRPWYLVVALLLCSVLGAYGSLDGYETIALYRTTQIDTSYVLREISQEANRQAAQASVDRLLGAMEQEKPKLFPLAAGELVIGLALFMLSIFAMAGRGGARSAVLQLVVAQAGLVVAMHVLTPKVRAAEVDLGLAVKSAQLRENGTDSKVVDEAGATYRRIEPYLDAAKLGVRTALAILVLVALTRPRTRAFYEARRESPNEG